MAAQQLSQNIRTFPLRFSGVRSDDQHRWDISTLKYFAIAERLRMQFRAECFNALNQTNFNNPNTSPVILRSALSPAQRRKHERSNSL